MIEEYFRRENEMDFAKGVLAGAAGGLLASLLMEQFQALWSTAAEKIEEQFADEEEDGNASEKQEQPSTVKVAQSRRSRNRAWPSREPGHVSARASILPEKRSAR